MRVVAVEASHSYDSHDTVIVTHGHKMRIVSPSSRDSHIQYFYLFAKARRHHIHVIAFSKSVIFAATSLSTTKPPHGVTRDSQATRARPLTSSSHNRGNRTSQARANMAACHEPHTEAHTEAHTATSHVNNDNPITIFSLVAFQTSGSRSV